MKVKLGDVCELINGYPFKPSDWSNAGLPIIRIQNLNDDTAPFNYFSGVIDKKYIVENGDLLFSWSGTPGTSFGAFFWNRERGVLNQHIFNVHLGEELLKDYLRYALNGNLQRIISKAHGGVGLQHITKKELESIEILVPPIHEQRRIAAVLDKVSDLIAKRRAQLDKLEELVKARFVEMFGETQYPRTALIKLIIEGASLSYGIIVPGDNVEDGVPMIRPSDFKHDNLCLDNVYRVAPEIEVKYTRTRLLGDEILVQVIGQPGQIMLADDRCKGMNVTRNLAVVRPNCNRINRNYLKIYMQTQEAQAFMLGETKQSTLKQLPLSKLKALEIPVPPMALQEQFAAFFEQTNKSKLSIQQSLDKLETLKKALMQEYFG